MAVPDLWGTRTSEYAKVDVVIITTQYGHTTSKVLATVQVHVTSSVGVVMQFKTLSYYDTCFGARPSF